MIKRFSRDISKYFRYSVVAAKAQLKSEVAGSYLNWVWWVLDPLSFMLIYTFIFDYVFKSQEPFFPVYIFIGLSMWDFFNKTVQGSVKMIKSNKSIVSKVYFPKYILLLTRVWVNGFKMLVSFSIVVGMMIVFRVPITWNILLALPILATLLLITFGCSCFLMHYGVYVNDLANVVRIITKMLFYITGIFYNLEARIPEYGALLNRFNPIAFLLTSMRQSVIYSSTPDVTMLLVWFMTGLLLSVFGIRKIYREENSYVKSI